jgi:hypothetical protein
VLQNRMYFALAQVVVTKILQDVSEVDQLQLLMDNTIKVKPTKKNSASVARLEGLSRRLMFKLHIKRTKVLLICNLNINLLDRPSSLATLASVKFSVFWNSFCHIASVDLGQ